MKTIDEILRRDDYARLTENLKSRVEGIAKRIRKKMDELELWSDNEYEDGITVDGVSVVVKAVTSRNCGTYRFLAILRYEGYEGIASLEDVGDSYYYAGDFNAWVLGATNKEALSFLNVAKKLIEKLDAIETEQVEKVNKALKETKDL